MKDNEEWHLFERLADPELPEAQRQRLESQIAADPRLQARFAAFRVLSDWPLLERDPECSAASDTVLARLVEEDAGRVAERELGRLFPVFISGALAAALALAMINFWEFGATSDDALDALFGMPEVSVETVIVSQL